MIGKDRTDLNKRFVEVFKLLEARGDVVMNDRAGKGMGDFAEQILGNKSYGHIVRAFLNPDDKRVIDYHHITPLCKQYGVNETFMMYGMGTPFGLNLPASDVSLESDTSGKANIMFTSVQAFAGAAVDAGSFASEDFELFSIPGMAGSGLVAFPIVGNSMEPVIMNYDIVICREINGVNDIKDNDIYAVKNNGAVWVKYVQKIHANPKKKRVTHLKLISANYLEHDPFEEEVNEYTKLYKVTRRISDM